MTRIVRYSRNTRILFLVALLLSLSLVAPAMAHRLTNGDFGAHPDPGCNLNGWVVSTTGNAAVAALTEHAAGLSTSTNCVAQLTAELPDPSEARLGQDFHVPSTGGPVWLTVDLWLQSGGGDSTGRAQFIGVYDSSGNPICTNWFNMTTDRWGSWNCDVTAESGKDIKVRAHARTDGSQGIQSAKAYMDRVRFGNDNTCPANGGGGDGGKGQVSARNIFQRGGFGDLDNGGKMCW